LTDTTSATEQRAVVLTAPKRFELRKLRTPSPGPDDVVIRVDECGICGSDIKMYAGTHAFMRPPIVMGHEIAGTISMVGAGVELAEGTPVTVFPPVGCGTCFHCRSGREQLCEEMEFFGGQRAGGLASHIVVPASHAVSIPSEVPADLRVLIEPVSVAVHGVTRGAPALEERAVVIGAGAIGLFTALILRHLGLQEIVVAEIDPSRLVRAERLGFIPVDTSREMLQHAVARLIRPEGADCVFECAGGQHAITSAILATRKGGRTIVVGNAPPTIEIDGLALQRGDRTIIGVLMYDLADFVTAMNLLSEGLLDGLTTFEMISRYTIDHVANAFRDAKSGRLTGLKAVVEL